MVLINMKMPECCANCPINISNNCILLDKTEGHIENPNDKRLYDCPLKSVNSVFKTKYKSNSLWK